MSLQQNTRHAVVVVDVVVVVVDVVACNSCLGALRKVYGVLYGNAVEQETNKQSIKQTVHSHKKYGTVPTHKLTVK